MVTPADRRTAVIAAMAAANISERRACRYTGFARASQRYQAQRPPRAALRARLHTLALLRPRWGYRRLYRLLRREGTIVHRKLVQRRVSRGRTVGASTKAEAGGRRSRPDRAADGAQ